MYTFDDLFRFCDHFVYWNRRSTHDANMFSRSWSLLSNPNNQRKMSGKPMVRLKAYEKAYRNERRCP